MPREYKLIVWWAVLAALLSLGVLLVASWTEVDVSVGRAILVSMVGSAFLLGVLLAGNKARRR
ncbi:MAG: hypothetical protein F4047_17845 [Caldilineaceae bacterium SB0670_bin_27]|nr:hypothetical protein [Chloroflexota bacterium]MYF79876.1 hypothetical protein [Chloroflexota bacterium]MYJ79957.1 hypothetical protein [Caldilineaceae bacterium SB0670_bin_27]